VAPVPPNKLGSARCRHFAHPAGLGPPGGHSNETTWHATGKQRIARWAASQGASTRVEAYTPDRKRHSDVAVTLPAGHQLAIEVQLGAVSDGEWLARHRDYAAIGVPDIWLWHGTTWVPRVMFEAGQPGWILDQDNDRLGLLYARPTIGSGTREANKGCGEVHWPPCIDDPIAIQWMALDTALLIPEGIQPAPRASEDLVHKAATARTARENAARHGT
jgi:Competence protein CoiA-like family